MVSLRARHIREMLRAGWGEGAAADLHHRNGVCGPVPPRAMACALPAQHREPADRSGFLASQRFESLADTPSPYSAMHEIASADVFESAIYRQRGGRASNGEWQKDMINWHRNLYSGLDATPEVADDAYLLFIDEQRDVAEREIALPPGVRVHWLDAGRPRPDHPASGHRGARRCRRDARDRQGRPARQGLPADHQENSPDQDRHVSASCPSRGSPRKDIAHA